VSDGYGKRQYGDIGRGMYVPEPWDNGEKLSHAHVLAFSPNADEVLIEDGQGNIKVLRRRKRWLTRRSYWR
jgi:hypothetical protein